MKKQFPDSEIPSDENEQSRIESDLRDAWTERVADDGLDDDDWDDGYAADPLDEYETRRAGDWYEDPDEKRESPLWVKAGIGAVSVIVVLSLLAGLVGPFLGGNDGAGSGTAASYERGSVLEVVDARTIIVELENGTEESVRYIGIDLPELNSVWRTQGRDAHSQLLRGAQIVLEADETDRDASGRLLRYVYLGRSMVNGLLIRNGLGSVSEPRDGNDRHHAQMLIWEEAARTDGLGLWSDDGDGQSETY